LFPSTTLFRSQGGDDRAVPDELQEKVLALLATGQERAYDEYESLLEDDVARELARINLPLSLYTEMYWQIDLNNLFHFLRLRLDWHAQYEIRAYGDAVATAAKAVCPRAHAARGRHVLPRPGRPGARAGGLRDAAHAARRVPGQARPHRGRPPGRHGTERGGRRSAVMRYRLVAVGPLRRGPLAAAAARYA